MPDTIFSSFPTVKFEGTGSSNPLAYEFYDAQQSSHGQAAW